MSIIFSRDDLIPWLESIGIAAELTKWIPKNFQESTILDILSDFCGIQLSSLQLKELLADLLLAGKLEWAAISGDSLPTGTTRPAKPSGMGIVSGGNVWCSSPGEGAVLRFYVNGVHKLTQTVVYQDGIPAGGYITSLASIGAVSGDTVAIAQVAPADVLEGETVITPAGTVGWWARAMVG